MTSFEILQSLQLPLLLFTLLATFTPGPNNIFLTLSGSQFGYRKSMPFVLGIRIGIVLLFIIMGCGVGALVVAEPRAYFVLKLLGAGYLIYLAGKVVLTSYGNKDEKQVQWLGIKQGILLQFVNPKSMLMVLSCVSAFSLPGDLYFVSLVQACLVFTLVGTFSNCCWVFFGKSINRFLSTPLSQKMFNYTLALLMLVAIALLFIEK